MTQTITTNDGNFVRRLITACVVMAAATIVAAVATAIAVGSASSKRVVVIGATESGQFIRAIPLDRPYLNEARVAAFATEALRASFSHNFVNYRKTMTEAQSWYTPIASESYTKAIAPLLEEISQKRMVMSLEVVQPAIVSKAYLDGQRFYTWELQAIVSLMREGQSERVVPVKYLVEMTVTRVPLDVSIRGVLVSAISLKPAPN
jgi:intracellular multiplication protein IcmL